VGIFDRLFHKPSQASSPAAGPQLGIVLDGDDTLHVVGESYRQDTLWQLVGGVCDEEVRFPIVAQLLPEPTNEYDHNAVQVLIDGQQVGYLSREDAAEYHMGVERLVAKSPGGLVLLHGMVCGGGVRMDGRGRLGVFLDHDPADFGIEEESGPHYASLSDVPAGSAFRTGLSEARATDLEDDSYDLSWLDGVSSNVPTAIQQLRSLLQTVDDPIDRHYMLAELEHRLYAYRKVFASALEEYDSVCRDHDAAMDEIRTALFAKFGRLPILDTYRQAGVRWQQAKDWEAARWWCERGLELYGDDAAKPDFVEDLRKRLAHAVAKIEAASHPKPKPHRAPRPPQASESEPVIEILVCAICGSSFERVRTRGRKPSTCASCRGEEA
jgi:hypothetical protein